MDYSQNSPVTLQFENCNTTQCHCIPIVDDDVLEGNETFYVSLERASDRDRDKIVLHPVNGTIDILDNEKCEYVSMHDRQLNVPSHFMCGKHSQFLE